MKETEQVKTLKKLLKRAYDRLSEHHEIGHVSKAKMCGRCELCRDGLFVEIDNALKSSEVCNGKS